MSNCRVLYNYEPLSRDFDQMRLLKLMPPSSSGDIEIVITHVPSSAPPAYEALSYVWGSPERTHGVVVKTLSDILYELAASTSVPEKKEILLQRIHPRYLPISRNLFIALQHLRLPKEPRLLWIDAIYINQDNVPERNEQVKMMGSIYHGAHRVILWLGEEADESTLAVQTLRNLGEGVDVFSRGHLKSVSSKAGSLAKLLKNSPEDMAQMATSWFAIKNVFARPWFTRLWVIQEMALAAEVIVMVGAAVLPLSVFQAALFWIHTMYYKSTNLLEILDFTTLDQATSINLCSSRSNLMALVMLTRNTHCFDPRDRIYAILSLLSPGFSAGIAPDYSRAPEEICKDTTLHYISHHEQLDLLTLCRFHHPASPASVLGLPSWVFDFSVSYQLNDFINVTDASGLSRGESRYEPSENSLTIQGLQICVIDQVFEAVPFDAKLPEILAICQTWERAGAGTCTAAQARGVPWSDTFIATIFSKSIVDALLLDEVLDMQILKELYMIACEQRSFWTPSSEGVERQETQYASRIELYLLGRRMFRTHSGMTGLCSSWAASGDIVVVALGCKVPLILRPTEGNYYQVGGQCFLNGMMDGEALLGPLSAGSQYGVRMVEGINSLVFIDGNGIPTRLDPRAGPLPPGWSVHYGNSDEPDVEIEDGELKRQRFHHSETGEWSQWDPRLTSKNLKKIGVDIQEFILV